MGLHQEIKAACAEAAPAIARAAEGSEASIHNLPGYFADLARVLVKNGAVIDALKHRGITVTVEQPTTQKYA